MRNQLQDLDQKKAARYMFESGWNARGDPWANLTGLLFVLAFLSYVAFLCATS